ncbi:MAG: hypothetical protein GY937_13565 [bacterium]|nr:hypothetical protein [bacterium]
MQYDEIDSQKLSKGVESRELELLYIRKLMSDRPGRAFMARCLLNTGMGNTTFDVDPYKHARNAGLQVHGLWLASELKAAAPDDFIQMLKEHDI